jgi:hypothetical protein
MQKKILSAVLALCLVGSASAAFAGYYEVDVDVSKSFNDQSDDDGLDLDVNKSLNNMDNDHVDLDITNSGNKTYDIDVSKETNVDVNAQGNGVIGKFVVQQFGGNGGAGAGDVVNIDNSINGSTINSHNHTDSYNTNKTKTKTSTHTYNVNNSHNSNSSYNSSTNAWIGVDIDESKNFTAKRSFNRNKLGAPRPPVWEAP